MQTFRAAAGTVVDILHAWFPPAQAYSVVMLTDAAEVKQIALELL
jgi:hypothetical protein